MQQVARSKTWIKLLAILVGGSTRLAEYEIKIFSWFYTLEKLRYYFVFLSLSVHLRKCNKGKGYVGPLYLSIQ
jgi:hypothetical protein